MSQSNPYVAPAAGEYVAAGAEAAGFAQRAVALIIDGIAIGVVQFIIYAVLGMENSGSHALGQLIDDRIALGLVEALDTQDLAAAEDIGSGPAASWGGRSQPTG